jgi:peroxiredoxin
MKYSLFAFLLFLLACSTPSREQVSRISQFGDSVEVSTVVEADTLPDTEVEQFGMVSNPGGLLAGTFAPDFSAYDHLGQPIQLSQLLNNGTVILLFYRGQWCPVCNKYMKAMRDSLPALHQAGAQVLAITPETPDNAKVFLEKTEINLPVISDSNREIMASYKVLFEVTATYQEAVKNKLNTDIAANNGSSRAYLPVPAAFVIEPSGKIIYAQYSPDYMQRATAAELLATLEKMK